MNIKLKIKCRRISVIKLDDTVMLKYKCISGITDSISRLKS